MTVKFPGKFAGKDVMFEVMEAPSGDGITPVNPMGQCFDLVGFQAIGPEGFNGYRPPTLRICHGIGWTNYPDKPRKKITHAWLEWDDEKKGKVALDAAWQVVQSAAVYRRNFQAEYVVEYDFGDFMKNWALHDNPGPWDPKLKALQTILDAEKERK